MSGELRTVTVQELHAAMDAGDVELIDVREPFEFAGGHLPGATPMPLMTVPGHLGELPDDVPVYVVCAVGARSAQAAAFLAQRGIDAVNVEGGTDAWVDAGYPVER
jgi:rhodanese-related sulfurtransferase